MSPDVKYRVEGFGGVACRFVGYPQRYEPYTDEEGFVETGEGEWVDDLDSGRVLVVMVGDDYKHSVLESNCTPIGDTDYCAECGQIGCTHDGREREDACQQ